MWDRRAWESTPKDGGVGGPGRRRHSGRLQ